MKALNDDYPVRRFWKRLQIFAVLFLALAIQFFRIGERTFHGDETWSLKTVHEIGTSLHSVSYFLILRLWQLGGTSEFWLRSLSALFAVSAVVVTFIGIKRFWGKREVAFVTSTLLATSPFLIGYAQQVRFYTLYLLAACLSMWTFIAYLIHPSRRQMLFWGLATCFLLTTHGMSILLIIGELITLFLLQQRFTRWQKITTLSMTITLIVLLLSVEPVRELGFKTFAWYTNAVPTYSASKGLSMTQVAKIPFAFFFLTFGESVYPLFYPLVIPGILIYGLVFIIGLWRLRKQPAVFTFVVATGASSLVLLYLVFEALSPPTYAQAAPRYLIFLLPLIYFVVTIGSQGKKLVWIITALLLVNMGSLASYWNRNWSHADDLINWRTVKQWISGHMTPETVVLLDGRAQDIAKWYFPDVWNRKLQWPYLSSENLDDLTKSSRIIFVSCDFHTERRKQGTALLGKIQRQYYGSAVWAQYPLFVYVYDKGTYQDRYVVDLQTGSIDIPKEIYGLEFQDLRLPFEAEVLGRRIQSSGSFGLPTQDGRFTLTIPLAALQPTRKLILLTNVTSASKPASSSPVAILTVDGENGDTHTFVLREGYETSAWNHRCQPPMCQKAYVWRKRLVLLGAKRYPESWREFNASIFATELHLNKSIRVHSLKFERTSSSGMFHVWGIFLES